jgi:hypothetical protein
MSTSIKVRIFIDPDRSECHEIPLKELKNYIDILQSYTLMDEDGTLIRIASVTFDIHQNSMDVACEAK